MTGWTVGWNRACPLSLGALHGKVGRDFWTLFNETAEMILPMLCVMLWTHRTLAQLKVVVKNMPSLCTYLSLLTRHKCRNKVGTCHFKVTDCFIFCFTSSPWCFASYDEMCTSMFGLDCCIEQKLHTKIPKFICYQNGLGRARAQHFWIERSRAWAGPEGHGPGPGRSWGLSARGDHWVKEISLLH